jgi:hypothetical protein
MLKKTVFHVKVNLPSQVYGGFWPSPYGYTTALGHKLLFFVGDFKEFECKIFVVCFATVELCYLPVKLYEDCGRSRLAHWTAVGAGGNFLKSNKDRNRKRRHKMSCQHKISKNYIITFFCLRSYTVSFEWW